MLLIVIAFVEDFFKFNADFLKPAAPAPAWPTFSFSATASSSNGKAETPKKDENGKEEKGTSYFSLIRTASTPSKSTSEDKDKKETPETKKVFGDFSWISKAASESDNKETKVKFCFPFLIDF